MVIDMNEKKLVTLAQSKEFLTTTQEGEFQGGVASENGSLVREAADMKRLGDVRQNVGENVLMLLILFAEFIDFAPWKIVVFSYISQQVRRHSLLS